MPAITRKQVLMNMTFGQRIAEEEERELAKYFVETEQWRQISSGRVDIVYGPKGSGKSALYALLQDKKGDLFNQKILMVSGENPRGATVFKDLVDDPPTSENEFVNLWKLYFLTLVGGLVREYAAGSSEATLLITKLEEAKLLPTSGGLKGLLKAVAKYVRPAEIKGEATLFDETSFKPSVSGSILFREPETEERKLGKVSVDELFATADEALLKVDAKVWILLDRLDVAFAESAQFEANALRALFKVYLDLLSRQQIQLKIFLRSDIWKRIMKERGFREASHITKHTTIKWDKASLINLMIRRAIQSPQVLEYVGMTAEQALSNAKQEDFLNKLFPDQVDAGANRSKTIDWILNRITDGSGLPAPRELIHFLNTTREEEMRSIELGGSEGDENTLFGRQAIKNALPEVSKVRLEQTLYAEYPDLRPYISGLEREKSTQFVESLSKIWHTDESEASKLAEQLTDVGFFEKTGDKDSPVYRVPFIYRPALDLVQGAAD
jgi:hypothetical protein